jgi:CHAT domain-containing protein
MRSVYGWLWDAVMSPVLERLKGFEAVTLIASGHTAALPFHLASHTAGGDVAGSRGAIDEVTLTVAPNARALAPELPARAFGQSDVLCIADPQPTSAAPLPAARLEAQVIAALAGGRARLLTGDAASVDAVLAGLRDADVAHFACHGAANASEPLRSGLLLSGDQWLTLGDLLSLRLPRCSLAVLSSCDSGVSGEHLPDEMLALPAGFLHAGVECVVASLWRVPDAATAFVMAAFYDEWRLGASPAFALRQAQRWVRDSTDREKRERFRELSAALELHPAAAPDDDARSFEDPFYWGAFVYVGR